MNRPFSRSTSVPLVRASETLALRMTAALLVALATAGLSTKAAAANPADGEPAEATTTAASRAKDEKADDGWKPLFNGRNLDGWKVPEFGGEGDVYVKDGRIVMEMGADITGVNYAGRTPKINYEVAWEAMRVKGSDFFCALTFPVKDDPCTVVLGGWGGGLCGLSSLNGMDASENETTTYFEFKNERWYRMRLRVAEDRIQAWIDDEKIIDQKLMDHRISIRWEVEPSKPFGFATYQTTGAVRNVRIRELGDGKR
jgi:hypothetical protein